MIDTNIQRPVFNIRVEKGTYDGRKLLSCSDNGEVVDLLTHDDGSGRQKWVLTPLDTQITSNKDRIRKARVLYDYIAEPENESSPDNQLTVSEGQIITLIGDVTPDNWIMAKSTDGKQGYIPNGYVEVISEEGEEEEEVKETHYPKKVQLFLLLF